MLISRKKYNDLLAALDKAIENNHELRKTCQCRECRWGLNAIGVGNQPRIICDNNNVFDYGEMVSPYGSCEKCERR